MRRSTTDEGRDGRDRPASRDPSMLAGRGGGAARGGGLMRVGAGRRLSDCPRGLAAIVALARTDAAGATMPPPQTGVLCGGSGAARGGGVCRNAGLHRMRLTGCGSQDAGRRMWVAGCRWEQAVTPPATRGAMAPQVGRNNRACADGRRGGDVYITSGALRADSRRREAGGGRG